MEYAYAIGQFVKSLLGQKKTRDERWETNEQPIYLVVIRNKRIGGMDIKHGGFFSKAAALDDADRTERMLDGVVEDAEVRIKVVYIS